MTFADTAVRAPWFDTDYRPRRREATTVYTVRWLGMAVGALVVAALGALVLTPARSSSASVVSSTSATGAAATQPFQLQCGPIHVGDQAKFTATFGVTGVAANTSQWQIDYGDGESVAGTALNSVPAHTYTVPGKYVSLLTTRTAAGATASSYCVTTWIVAQP